MSEALEPRIVWLLGGPRSGSTWLLELLCHPLTAGGEMRPGAGRTPLAVPVNEPYLGVHLDPVVSVVPQGVFTASSWRANDPSYFFAATHEDAWLPQLRELILSRLGAQAGAAAAAHGLDRPLVVVKEPNGSHAAPILGRTLPGSRLLFLLRDGRDVLDSQLDAVSRGGWLAGDSDPEGVGTPDGRLAFLRRSARLWAHRTDAVQRAVAAHAPELTLTVRYEDLRADAPAQLHRIADWLGIAPAPQLDEAAAATAFESLPAEAVGRGKTLRFATPGRWRQSFSAGERIAIGEIIGPKLSQLGYGD